MDTKMRTNRRIRWIDMLKGLAIILVVIGHVVDGYYDVNLWPDRNVVLKGIYNFIYAFHMPFCFVLSGFLYGNSYLKDKKPDTKRIKAHCFDFAIVYLVFSFLMWAFKLLMSGSVNKVVDIKSILYIWGIPMPTYWYFYVLIALYVIFAIERVNQLKCKIKFPILLFISIFSTLAPEVRWFQVSRIAFYALFFQVGVDIAKGNLKTEKHICIASLTVGLCLDLMLSILGLDVISLPVISTGIALLISFGLLGTFAETKILKNSEGKAGGVLEYIGLHMQEIYVTHCFAAPAIRMLLIKMQITNIVICLLVTTVIGIAAPIIFGEALKKLKMYNFVFRPYSRTRRSIRKKEFLNNA